MIQIVELPSFNDAVGREIYQFEENAVSAFTEFVACTTRWHASADAPRFREPITLQQFTQLDERDTAGPTVTYAIFPLDSLGLQQIERRIARLSLSALLLPPNSIGL